VDAAEAAFRLGKEADSEKAMKRALEINPGFPRAGAARRFLEMLAIAANPSDPADMGKVDAVLKSSPNDAPALMAAGAVQELKRDAGAARKSYEKVLSLYPEHVVAKKRFAILAATAKDTDLKKALEHATKARETYPDDADVAKALGIIMYRQGTYPRAATLLQESSRKRENDAEVFFYLGMTKQKQQSKTDAKAALQRALELKLGGDDAAEARKALAELK
jgi:tetratricopeptide (TPR) repeat protein